MAECVQCGCRHCPVSHTIPREISYRGKKYKRTRRRRVCRNCGYVFYTNEVSEDDIPEDKIDSKAVDLPPDLLPDPNEPSGDEGKSNNPYL